MASFNVPRGDPNNPAVLSSSQWSRIPIGSYQDGANIFLGFEQNGMAQGYLDNSHMLLIAGSRAGKGISCIIPALLSYKGSCLVIDPKGENAKITRGWRESIGQTCHVLDPFGKTPFSTASFDPIEAIAKSPKEEQEDDAALLADSLVIQEQGGGADTHWNIAARNLLTGLILFAVDMQRTLIDVRNWITQLKPSGQGNNDENENLLQILQGHQRLAVQRAANSLAHKNEREASGIISTAAEQLGFLDSPAMARVLESHDFDLSALKQKPTTIYLCLPAMRMGTHARWFELCDPVCGRYAKNPD